MYNDRNSICFEIKQNNLHCLNYFRLSACTETAIAFLFMLGRGLAGGGLFLIGIDINIYIGQ